MNKKKWLISAAAVSLLGFAAQNAAALRDREDGCRPALASDASTFQNMGVPASYIESLRRAYYKIAYATNLFPDLKLCSGPANANFHFDNYTHRPTISFYVGIITLVSGSEQMLSAFMAHEMAHMQLQHIQKKTALAQQYVDEAEQNGTPEAFRAASEGIRMYVQGQEADADEKGALIAHKAGLDESVMPRALAMLQRLEDPFDNSGDHPAIVLRVLDTEEVAKNEHYLRIAESQFNRRDMRALDKTVTRWQQELPGSGAAAFYLGMLRAVRGKPYAPEAFGESVGNYYGEGMRLVGQSEQPERRYAAVLLCVTQYLNGDKLGAVHCLNAFGDTSTVSAFKRITHWDQFILMGPRNDRLHSILYGARVPGSNELVLTNCSGIAQSNQMRSLQLWRPPPLLAPASGDPSTDVMLCDPEGCNCTSTSEELRKVIKDEGLIPTLR